MTEPDKITLRVYSEAAHLEHFAINAGDQEGVLTGTRLDEVASLDLKGIHFLPVALSRANQTALIGSECVSNRYAARTEANSFG